MLITGYKYRSLPEREVCSYNLSLSLSSAIGCSKFAFSGGSNEWVWNFQSGRIIDPNNKFIGGYSTDEWFSISGNISGGYHNYSYNEDFTAQSTRTNFPINSFYVNTSSNCDMEAEINIMAPAQPYSFSLPTSYITGSSFTFGLINGDTGRSFKVFSGQMYQSGQPSSSFSIPSSQFPITVQTGANIIIQDTGSSEGISYPLNFNLWTSFGTINTQFSVVDNLPSYTSVFSVTNYNNSGYADFGSINSNAQSLIQSGISDTVKYGNWSLFYAINNSGQAKNIRVSLDATSGHTGSYFGPFVSGIQFTHTGDYATAPVISFSGGGGAGAAATVTLTAGYISSYTMTNYGSGYTSAPTVYFAGGTPTVTASGTAILSGYSKSFTGVWNLYTGDSSSTYVNFRNMGYTGIGGTGYLRNGDLPFYTNDLLITVSNRVYYDTDKSYALLSISGLDNNIYSTTISGGSL